MQANFIANKLKCTFDIFTGVRMLSWIEREKAI